MIQLLKDIATILTIAERKKFTTLILLDVFTSVLDILFLLLLVFVAGHYTQTYSIAQLPPWLSTPLQEHPLLLIGIFTFLYAGKNAMVFFISRKQFGFVYEVASRISGNNLSAYLDGSYTNYVTIDSSVHVRKISQQPVEFSHYVLRGVQQVIGNAVLILLAAVPVVFFNPVLFVLLTAVLLPPAFLTMYITRKKLAAMRSAGKKNREKTIQHLQEALTGYIESNIYHRKDFFLRRYKHYQEKFNAGLSEHQVMQNLPSRLIEVFAVLGLFLLIVFHTYISNAGDVPVLLVGGFMAAAYKIIPGLVKILNSIEQVRTYSFTIKDLLAEQKNTTFVVQPCTSPILSMEMKEIHFAYGEEKVLRDFNMHLQPGDFAGLAGPSGKGKTTLIHLLLGFLQPLQGQVLVNSRATSMQERQAWWPRISYIRQQSFFIHDSIRNNIILEEVAEKEKLQRVVEVTGVDSVVETFPEGINAILSENGKNVSGGQRQRIVLARALYKDADLVILDEPFNGLDRVSEDRLLDYFRDLASTGKIVLLVTHNSESLSFCNKIISLNEN